MSAPAVRRALVISIAAASAAESVAICILVLVSDSLLRSTENATMISIAVKQTAATTRNTPRRSGPVHADQRLC